MEGARCNPNHTEFLEMQSHRPDNGSCILTQKLTARESQPTLISAAGLQWTIPPGVYTLQCSSPTWLWTWPWACFGYWDISKVMPTDLLNELTLGTVLWKCSFLKANCHSIRKLGLPCWMGRGGPRPSHWIHPTSDLRRTTWKRRTTQLMPVSPENHEK